MKIKKELLSELLNLGFKEENHYDYDEDEVYIVYLKEFKNKSIYIDSNIREIEFI